MIKAALAFAPAVLFLPSFVLAQAPPNYLFGVKALGLVHNAAIEVVDNVTDNCWTNAEAIKQKARLTLEQSGINVYLEPLSESFPYAASIYISAYGERSPASICYGVISVSVSDTASRYIGDTPLPSRIIYFEDESVAMGSDLNSQFSESAENSINTLAGTILSGRRNELAASLIEEHGDELLATPETQAELWERLGIDMDD